MLPGVVERNQAGPSDMLRGRLQSSKASPYFRQVKLGMEAKIEASIVRLVSSSQPTINFVLVHSTVYSAPMHACTVYVSALSGQFFAQQSS